MEGTRPIAARFLELCGDAGNGGFVLRRFEQLVPAEVRTCGAWSSSATGG